MSEEITKEYLDDLCQELDLEHINYMSLVKMRDQLPEVRDEIDAQLPEEHEIIAEYTENQYVQNEIEVSGLTLKLRTLPPHAVDEAMEFASSNAGRRDQSKYQRLLSRRRLAYSLIEVNGRTLCSEPPPQGSYFDIISTLGVDELKKQVLTFGEKNYEALTLHGLTDKMIEIFGVWEKAVFDRMNGIDDMGGVLKK